MQMVSTDRDHLHEEETICMKSQIPFSRKNKKNIISLLSAEFAHSMVSVNTTLCICWKIQGFQEHEQ